MTSPQRWVSLASSWPSCSGEPPRASMCMASSCFCTSGVLSAAWISRLRRCTTAAGVLAGAATAFQDATLKPFSPLSATVGTSGKVAERFSPITASARKARALICGTTGLRISTAASICPPRRAVITAGVPLKGTTCTSTPALVLNSSAARFCVLPTLMVPTFSLPGLARA